MIDVMIDLETLGRRPGCKILSLGAVVFTKQGLTKEFYTEVQRSHQGFLTVDPATVAWWEEQDPEVSDRLFTNQDKKPTLRSMLTEFDAWLSSVAEVNDRGELGVRIWGNGADFDNAILQVAYEAMAKEPSWPFWNNRCYRTLKGLATVIKLERRGPHHNALHDATSQAAHAIKLLNFLQAW